MRDKLKKEQSGLALACIVQMFRESRQNGGAESRGVASGCRSQPGALHCRLPLVGTGTGLRVHCANLAVWVLLTVLSVRMQAFQPLAPVSSRPPGKKKKKRFRATKHIWK